MRDRRGCRDSCGIIRLVSKLLSQPGTLGVFQKFIRAAPPCAAFIAFTLFSHILPLIREVRDPMR
jgi:hypothetical protein